MNELLGIANISMGILNLYVWTNNKSGLNLIAGWFCILVGILMFS